MLCAFHEKTPFTLLLLGDVCHSHLELSIMDVLWILDILGKKKKLKVNILEET